MNGAPTRKPQGLIPKENPPPSASDKKRWAVFAPVAVLALLFGALKLSRHLGFPGDSADAIVVLLLTAAALLALSRNLPLQNILGLAVVMAIFSGALLLAGSVLKTPLAPPMWNKNFLHLKTWSDPLLWLLALVSARGAAKIFLRALRRSPVYGFWLMAVTLLLVAGLEGLIMREWKLVFWKLVPASLAYALTLPWFLEKKPQATRPDPDPLLILLLILFW